MNRVETSFVKCREPNKIQSGTSAEEMQTQGYSADAFEG